jgi:OHCU decarboxylase
VTAAALLDRSDAAEAGTLLLACCGSLAWVDAMVAARPFGDDGALFERAERLWWALTPEDWLEAFAVHPHIGDVEALRAKVGRHAEWSAGEQASAVGATEETLQELARCNLEYERRFGYTFIVCATGRSVEEMLAALRQRLENGREAELRLAAAEQLAITRLRLGKLGARAEEDRVASREARST